MDEMIEQVSQNEMLHDSLHPSKNKDEVRRNKKIQRKFAPISYIIIYKNWSKVQKLINLIQLLFW